MKINELINQINPPHKESAGATPGSEVTFCCRFACPAPDRRCGHGELQQGNFGDSLGRSENRYRGSERRESRGMGPRGRQICSAAAEIRGLRPQKQRLGPATDSPRQREAAAEGQFRRIYYAEGKMKPSAKQQLPLMSLTEPETMQQTPEVANRTDYFNRN